MSINGGRSLKGVEESGYERFNISLPPSIVKRLAEFMEKEERPRSWTIQKALDEYLGKRGY